MSGISCFNDESCQSPALKEGIPDSILRYRFAYFRNDGNIFLLRFALFFILSFIALPLASQAQNPSVQSRFEVNHIRGCAPLLVEVTRSVYDTDPNTEPIYKFNFQDFDRVNLDANQPATGIDTTYTEPGIYEILQIAGTVFDSITIEVLEPRTPQYRVYNCLNNSIFVEINDNYYDQLSINFGDGTVEEVVTTTPSFTHDYATGGEYTVTVQGLFNNAESSDCGRSDTTVTTITTLTLTQADIQLLEVESETQINFTYDLPNVNVSYRIEVAEDESDDFTWATFEVDGAGSGLLDDPRFNTSEHFYCFRIAAVNRCDENQNLYSETLCSIALQGKAQNAQNEINWQSEGFTSYGVYRDDNLLNETSNITYTDTEVECQQIYNYRIVAQSPEGASSSALLPIIAQSNTTSPALDSVNVSVQGTSLVAMWRPVEEVQAYIVRRGTAYDSTSVYDTLLIDSVTISAYQDEGVTRGEEYCYEISYLDECGNESARSALVCATVPNQGQLYFPNAFTPNGDGLNDVFTYRANLVESVELQIFNRWGELMFFTDQLDVGWDGTYQGVVAPQGTYVYKAQVKDQLGNDFIQTGQVLLLQR